MLLSLHEPGQMFGLGTNALNRALILNSKYARAINGSAKNVNGETTLNSHIILIINGIKNIEY